MAKQDAAETLGDVTDLEALHDVDVEITAVLGTAMMPVSQILKLGRGAVVELDSTVGSLPGPKSRLSKTGSA
jgi:flagellar motor switch protein FliN/FliY